MKTDVLFGFYTNHEIGFCGLKTDMVFGLLELDLGRAPLEVNSIMEIMRHELHKKILQKLLKNKWVILNIIVISL